MYTFHAKLLFSIVFAIVIKLMRMNEMNDCVRPLSYLALWNIFLLSNFRCVCIFFITILYIQHKHDYYTLIVHLSRIPVEKLKIPYNKNITLWKYASHVLIKKCVIKCWLMSAPAEHAGRFAILSTNDSQLHFLYLRNCKFIFIICAHDEMQLKI